MSWKKWADPQVGDRVRALRSIDRNGADVGEGDEGVVDSPAEVGFDYYYGPLVVWDAGGVCNVYPGWVAIKEASDG